MQSHKEMQANYAKSKEMQANYAKSKEMQANYAKSQRNAGQLYKVTKKCRLIMPSHKEM
jgi:hypothetical protein